MFGIKIAVFLVILEVLFRVKSKYLEKRSFNYDCVQTEKTEIDVISIVSDF